MEKNTMEKMAQKGLIDRTLLEEAGLWNEDDEDTEDNIDIKPVTEETSLRQTLYEMLTGMAVWGIVCEFVGIWFVPDQMKYTFGLWIGILLAAGMAAHIAWSVNWAVDLNQKSAENKIRLHAVLRYVVVLAVFAVLIFTDFANPLAAFLGIICLKVSAFLQPFAHKLFNALKRRK